MISAKVFKKALARQGYEQLREKANGGTPGPDAKAAEKAKLVDKLIKQAFT